MGFLKKLFKRESVEPVQQEQKKPEPMKQEPQVKEKPRKYHVTYNRDSNSEHYKMWRVRKEHSDKTIKYFKTQKEAIVYAELLAQHAGSSVVVHKMDGTIRKQNYS